MTFLKDRWPILLGVGATVTFCFWLTSFQIFDADFFWHVKAGQVMRETGGLIHVEPFAYTRIGQPYLATHEWLAQIILSLAYDLGGPTGVILLRGVLVSVTFTLLIAIAGSQLLWFVPLAALGATMMLGNFVDRPHLFTFVCFAAVLLLVCRALQRHDPSTGQSPEHSPEGSLWRLPRSLWLLMPIQILWVNLHGGAALLTLFIVGCLFLQRLSDAWVSTKPQVDFPPLVRAVVPLLLLIFALLTATFVSPNGIHTFTYLWALQSDQTAQFISEWQPRALASSLAILWPFLVLSITSLFLGRRSLVFAIPLLLVTLILSRLAMRHEALFILTSVAVSIFQLTDSSLLARAHDGVTTRRWPFLAALAAILLLLGWYAHRTSSLFEQRYHAAGYGMRARTREAVAFLDRHGIEGPMFNTYNLGSELLFWGYPERQVFIDGRNVDYGFPFMSRVIQAGTDRATWQSLKKEYGFTHAVIDYDAVTAQSGNAYIQHLENDPAWALVYLDDAVAIYVRMLPEYTFIPAQRYHTLTPRILKDGTALKVTSAREVQSLELEMRRMLQDSPSSIKARLLLARLGIAMGVDSQVEPLIHEALTIDPTDYRIHEVLGLLRASQQRWEEADSAFKTTLRLAGDDAAALCEYFVTILTHTGNVRLADSYRQCANENKTKSANGKNLQF